MKRIYCRPVEKESKERISRKDLSLVKYWDRSMLLALDMNKLDKTSKRWITQGKVTLY